MATIAELNIRLGLLTKEFDRELRGVERKMKQAGQQLSSMGSDLTAAVSLPLVGLGFAAIKSAGDIEALRLALTTTMTDAGASTAEVTAELEALRVAALAPGLDFEQAIKASVRLQNVGFSANEAREAIIGMAKAVALSGGTADDLNEVTNQFSQMIGKGKVFQDDIKIITGRMPKLAAIMKETFGTTTAEGINALGISAKEFVSTVVGEMNKLPQVSSGIKNSLVNLFVGLQLEAARVGEEINKAFNIGGVGDGILSAVKFIVDGFAGLTDGSKKLIVGMAAVAAAAGPVVFVFGKILAFLAPIRTGFLAAAQAVTVLNTRMAATSAVQATLQSGAKAYAATVGVTTTATQGLSVAFASTAASAEKSRQAGRLMADTIKKTGDVSVGAAQSFTGMSAVLQRATVAFQALNIAQKALLFGGIIAAIAAVAIVYNELTHELNATEKAQLAVNKVAQQASDDISTERTRVVELAGVLKDQNATRDEQKRALEALQTVAPEYFSNLDTEKIKIGDVDQAVNAYIDSLLRAAKAKRAFARLEELDKLRETIVAAAEPTTWQTIVNGFKAAGNGATFAGLQASQLGDNFAKLKEEIEAEEKAMREVIKANGDFVATAAGAGAASNNIAGGAKVSTEAQKAAEKQTKLYKDALASIAAVAQKGDVLGSEVISEQAREIENQIEKLLENGFKPYSKQITHLRGMLVQLRADLGKGFDTPNLTQQEVGFNVNAPQIPGISIPDQVVRVDTTSAQDSITALNDLALAGIESGALYKNQWEQAADVMRNLGDGITGFSEGISLAMGTAIERGNVMQSVMLSVGQATANAAAEGATSFRDLAAAGVSAAAKLVRSWIQQGVAAAVAKALSGIPFPFNLAAGAVAGAAAATLFNKAISAIGVPALAAGGVIDRPTLALVGEYAGAGSNPEIVTPENKLTNVFTDVLNSFEFPFPEANPIEKQTAKQEPPVVNIKLGEVTPNDSISNTVENVFSGFKMPEINIFQDGENTPSDQPAPSIGRTIKNIAQSISMPEIPRIQAPTTEITSRDIFTSIAPTPENSSPADTLTAVVRGDDLLFLLDKAGSRRARTK